MDVDLDLIFEAFAAWERAELPTLSGDSTFQAYSHFPTQDDLNVGATVVPFTIHVMVQGNSKMQTVGDTTIEDADTHLFHTYLALALDINNLSAQQQKATQWAKYYRKGMLKHRMLTNLLAAPNNGSLISNDLAVPPLEYQFGFFEVLGMGIGGLLFPIMVNTGRHELAAGN